MQSNIVVVVHEQHDPIVVNLLGSQVMHSGDGCGQVGLSVKNSSLSEPVIVENAGTFLQQ